MAIDELDDDEIDRLMEQAHDGVQEKKDCHFRRRESKKISVPEVDASRCLFYFAKRPDKQVIFPSIWFYPIIRKNLLNSYETENKVNSY